MMFASKPLTKRNNDPMPWERMDGGPISRLNVEGSHWDTYAARPEYQHGKLPANPILVNFRNGPHNTAEAAQIMLDAIRIFPAKGWTPNQIDHAKKVLLRLKTLKKESN